MSVAQILAGNTFPPTLAVKGSYPGLPSAPTSLQATNITQTGCQVTWTAAVGATSYTAAATPTAGGAAIPGVVSGGLFAQFSGLVAGTTYNVVVTAINVVGSTPSAPLPVTTDNPSLPPGPPIGLAAQQVGTTSIVVSFQAPTTGGPPSGYGGYADDTINPTIPGVWNSPALTVTYPGLTPGTLYNCYVQSTNAAGGPVASAPLPVTTEAVPPGPPTGLTLSQHGATSFQVSWTAPAGGVTSYTGVATPAAGPVLNGAWVAGTTTMNFTGSTPATLYQVVVTAVDPAGSTPSVPFPVTTDPGAPPKPVVTNTTPPTISSNGFTVQWQPVPTATSYSVTATSDGGVTITGTVAGPFGGGYTGQFLQGVLQDTTYQVTATATNTGGSTQSVPFSLRTPSYDQLSEYQFMTAGFLIENLDAGPLPHNWFLTSQLTPGAGGALFMDQPLPGRIVGADPNITGGATPGGTIIDWFAYVRSLSNEAPGGFRRRVLISVGGAASFNTATVFPDTVTATNVAQSLCYALLGLPTPNPLNWQRMLLQDGVTPYYFDGVDLDLEQPTTGQSTQVAQSVFTFLQVIRAAIDAWVAVPANPMRFISASFQAPNIFSSFGPNPMNGFGVAGGSPYVHPTDAPSSLVSTVAAPGSYSLAQCMGYLDLLNIQFYNQGQYAFPNQQYGGWGPADTPTVFSNVLACYAWAAANAISTVDGRPAPLIYIGLQSQLNPGPGEIPEAPVPTGTQLQASLLSGINATLTTLGALSPALAISQNWLGGVALWQSPYSGTFYQQLIQGQGNEGQLGPMLLNVQYYGLQAYPGVGSPPNPSSASNGLNNPGWIQTPYPQ